MCRPIRLDKRDEGKTIHVSTSQPIFGTNQGVTVTPSPSIQGGMDITKGSKGSVRIGGFHKYDN